MMAYASRTGTRRNLEALRRNGWRLLVSPQNRRTEGFPYALDNGAWSAHCQGKQLCQDAFAAALDTLGPKADFVVAPDIVAGGMHSLDLTLKWLERCKEVTQTLIAVQDGIGPEAIMELLGSRVGIFLGGSTEYKLGTMAMWGEVAANRECWFHVGRVNSRRRIGLCAARGATSFDGTSVSRFACTMPRLENARRQPDLFRGVT